MINYLKGTITHKTPTYVLVEVYGVGYKVNISLNTYAQIEKQESVKLLTYLHIKEDSHTLYGFADDAERSLFVHLISVSGIGPNTAQILLSSLDTEEAKAAIIGEDVATLTKVKGVGPKTAKRIILDLKDKMIKDGGDFTPVVTTLDNTLREEALSGLVALGFNAAQVRKALNKIARSGAQVDTVEGLVKAALKELSS